MRAKFGSDPTAGSKILSFKFISRLSGRADVAVWYKTLFFFICKVQLNVAWRNLKKQNNLILTLSKTKTGMVGIISLGT